MCTLHNARIAHWDPWKHWATPEAPPGAHIIISELKEEA